uniref:Uncharacterized protein n=1 Tax=Nelumbo nucifera TaxID=4432 RepID=A0A822Y6I3_NELNU|nr:TPA_asm: hypothetical protein HUJ06_028417 [Nelumbo nucifera]
MCHPGLPLISPGDLAKARRWFALHVSLLLEEVNPQASTVEVPAAGGGGGGGGGGAGGSPRRCICSPTRHPGSFRCRQHHGEYEWGGRSRTRHKASNQRFS